MFEKTVRSTVEGDTPNTFFLSGERLGRGEDFVGRVFGVSLHNFHCAIVGPASVDDLHSRAERIWG